MDASIDRLFSQLEHEGFIDELPLTQSPSRSSSLDADEWCKINGIPNKDVYLINGIPIANIRKINGIG